MTVAIQTWHGCYDAGWKGLIVDAAFSHPAKFSYGLIQRIVRFGLEQGFWQKGDTIADPFGGVALGGIVCAYAGLAWRGVELEPRFVDLGNQNIGLHRGKLEAMGAPIPVLMQGDSRRFAEIVRASGVLTSPPYAESLQATSDKKAESIKRAQMKYDRANGHPGNYKMTKGAASMGGEYGTAPGQIGSLPAGDLDAAITSPPYAETTIDPARNFQSHKCPDSQPARDVRPAGYADGVVTSPPYADSIGDFGSKPDSVIAAWYERYRSQGGGMSFEKFSDSVKNGRRTGMASYGQTEGQIGALKDGQVDAVISSPPYADSVHQGGQIDDDKLMQNRHTGPNSQGRNKDGYGCSDGQIGALKEGAIDGAVTSPPYEKTLASNEDVLGNMQRRLRKQGATKKSSAILRQRKDGCMTGYEGYTGAVQESICNASGETYWQAMRQVYSQMHLAMRPGAVCAIVVKAYVKEGKIVDLPGQTMQLLRHLGFEVFLEVRAMLTKEWDESTLFDGKVRKKRARKSFFRRLAEAKGSPPIDYESVIWARTGGQS